MADKIVKIDIRVKADESARQLDNISKAVGNMNKNLKQTADTMDFFKNTANKIAGFSLLGFGIREVVEMADSMTLLTSRIGIFVGSGQKTIEVMGRLADMATKTKSSVTDVAEVFSRIITATQRLGISVESQLALTEILQQSFRLSGSTAAEATASTIQFAQALSFGQLRGQELRSVLSQNSVLATIFSKAIEGSGKDLYKFAEAGGFTTKFVLQALSENFVQIDERANKMSQTFAQTVTLAMNKFRLEVDKLNTEFNLNGNFAKMMDWLLNNGDAVLAIIATLAATAIPGLTKSILALDAAMLLNPVGIFAAAVGGLVYWILEASHGVDGFITEMKVLPKAIELAMVEILNIFDDPRMKKTKGDWMGTWLRDTVKELHIEIDNLRGKNINDIFKPTNTDGANIFQFNMLKDSSGKSGPQKSAEALAEAAALIKGKVKSLDEQIGELNIRFNRGSIGVDDFNAKLYALTKLDLEEKMKAGTVSLTKMADTLRDLKLANFARELEAGNISIERFNNKVKDFQIEKLKEKFHQGKKTAAEFYEQMLKFSNPSLTDIFTGKDNTGLLGGLTSYVESLGTTSQQISEIVKSNFKGMEDAIFQAVTKGKIDFSDFTASVINDLLRMVIRMQIIKPLVDGVVGYMSPNSHSLKAGQAGPDYSLAQADGGAWNRGVQMFANGGVFDSPTGFRHSGGLGVLGEAGPEAVMPLTRGADGKLGVHGGAPVTVNIINQNGSSVETKERTDAGGSKVIEVLIKNVVKDGMGNGEFDKVFKSNFNLGRRGQ